MWYLSERACAWCKQEAAAHEGFDSPGGEAGVVDDRKLVVLGLPWVTDEASLRKYFSQFGPLQARRAAWNDPACLAELLRV